MTDHNFTYLPKHVGAMTDIYLEYSIASVPNHLNERLDQLFSRPKLFLLNVMLKD